MKIKYLKLKNWLLVTVAGLLGMQQGCTFEEYGCPEADYRVKGTVVNEDGDPISGIGVQKVRDWNNSDGEWCYADTTDADGHFSVWVYPDFEYLISTVSLFDIDGEANGSYQDTTVEVSFEDVPLTGGDGRWYEGMAEKKITVTMRRTEE